MFIPCVTSRRNNRASDKMLVESYEFFAISFVSQVVPPTIIHSTIISISRIFSRIGLVICRNLAEYLTGIRSELDAIHVALLLFENLKQGITFVDIVKVISPLCPLS